MRVPGVVWIVVLVGLPLISEWLVQYFGAAVWVAPVAALLLIVVKVVQVVRDSGVGGDTMEVMREAKPEPSKASRILWG